MLADSVYKTSKAAIGELIGSLLVGTTLNYEVHRDFVRGASEGERKERKYLEMAYLAIRKDLTGGQ